MEDILLEGNLRLHYGHLTQLGKSLDEFIDEKIIETLNQFSKTFMSH